MAVAIPEFFMVWANEPLVKSYRNRTEAVCGYTVSVTATGFCGSCHNAQAAQLPFVYYIQYPWDTFEKLKLFSLKLCFLSYTMNISQTAWG